MLFLCFLWLMTVSIQERLQEHRDPLAKNLCVACRGENGWLQNRADLLDNTIGSVGPSAYGLDDVLDIVALLIGACGEFVDVVQQLAAILDEQRDLGFEFRQRLRHLCGTLPQLEQYRNADPDEDHDGYGREKEGNLQCD